jgi:hypothetical protein
MKMYAEIKKYNQEYHVALSVEIENEVLDRAGEFIENGRNPKVQIAGEAIFRNWGYASQDGSKTRRRLLQYTQEKKIDFEEIMNVANENKNKYESLMKTLDIYELEEKVRDAYISTATKELNQLLSTL